MLSIFQTLSKCFRYYLINPYNNLMGCGMLFCWLYRSRNRTQGRLQVSFKVIQLFRVNWDSNSHHLAHKFAFFFLFRAAHVVYGSSQASSQMGASAAGLQHSHSNARSKPHL